jgi:hypothetical protein
MTQATQQTFAARNEPRRELGQTDVIHTAGTTVGFDAAIRRFEVRAAEDRLQQLGLQPAVLIRSALSYPGAAINAFRAPRYWRDSAPRSTEIEFAREAFSARLLEDESDCFLLQELPVFLLLS